MKESNKLCTDLLPTYSDFEEYDGKTFIGYKLAEKNGGPNYYSIVTGLFRYKAGKIGPSSYTSLYKREVVHYNEHLKDRVSIFVNKEDAYSALSFYKEIEPRNSELVLLKMTLSGNLEKAKYTNKFVTNLDVVVGTTMDNIIQLEVLNK